MQYYWIVVMEEVNNVMPFADLLGNMGIYQNDEVNPTSWIFNYYIKQNIVIFLDQFSILYDETYIADMYV